MDTNRQSTATCVLRLMPHSNVCPASRHPGLDYGTPNLSIDSATSEESGRSRAMQSTCICWRDRDCGRTRSQSCSARRRCQSTLAGTNSPSATSSGSTPASTHLKSAKAEHNNSPALLSMSGPAFGPQLAGIDQEVASAGQPKSGQQIPRMKPRFLTVGRAKSRARATAGLGLE